MKKIIAVILSLTLALALGISAVAEEKVSMGLPARQSLRRFMQE